MILVDQSVGSRELLPLVKQAGVACELTALSFGDFCFEGHGPDASTITVGVERKTLHDMMTCIDDARYSGHQRIGMKALYDVSVLIVEGHWRPHEPQGFLMEGFQKGLSWGFYRGRGQRAMYSKLFRYLMSVSLSGVIVLHSRDQWQTAYNVCEMYHYFEKRWEQHTSLQELHKLNLPTLNRKPSLVRKWAADIEGIGVKLSDLAEKHFKKPITLATADEMDWMRIPGVGVKSAQQIYREIHGIRG